MPTYGGYSDKIVVTEKFVVKVPEGLDLKSAAPLLCAGITTWSPLRHWNVGLGSRVAVVGLGGLGHMAIKFSKALGADVTLFSRSPNKQEDARRINRKMHADWALSILSFQPMLHKWKRSIISSI